MTEENTNTTEQETTQKTFSEDYVKAIREEAKSNRLESKKLKGLLQLVTGLSDDDFDEPKVTAWKSGFENEQQKKVNEALTKANERLLQAEIKSLDGYDSKLVSRLIDRSEVKVTEDGTIEGLKEAVEALEAEFPQIKKAAETQNGANPPPKDFKGEVEKLKEDYDNEMKRGNIVGALAIMEKIKQKK